MTPSTRSERPQSLSRRSGSIAGSRSRITSPGWRSGSRSPDSGCSASRSKSPRGVDRDVRLPAKTEIVSPPLSAETSTQRRRPRFEPFGPKPDPTPTDGPDPYGDPDPEWLRIDWRQYLHTINVPAAGATVHYAEMGPPEEEQDPLAVVFVHGLSGCWQNWLENMPHFARRHRVLALDLPGFGSSPAPDWEISIPAYGRLLLEFCDAVGVRRLRRGRQLDGRLRRHRGGDRRSRAGSRSSSSSPRPA